MQKVETAPRLNIAVVADPLVSDELRDLFGEGAPAEDATVRARFVGPLDAVEGSLDAQTSAGSVHAELEADVTATPLSWWVRAQTPGLDVARLYPELDAVVDVRGTYEVRGRGTGWPDDFYAEITAMGGEQVLWDEVVDDLAARAVVEDGKVVVESAEATIGVGTVRLSGDVDVEGRAGSVTGTVRLPDLAALDRYGVEDIAGRATWTGTARFDVSTDVLRLEADGVVEVQALDASGVQAARLSGPVRVDLDGDAVVVEGESVLHDVEASGVNVARAEGSWSLTSGPTGVSGTAAVQAEGIVVPDATLMLATAQTDVVFAADAEGAVEVSGAAVLGPVGLGEVAAAEPGEAAALAFTADGGRVSFALVGDQLDGAIALGRGHELALQSGFWGDLERGLWRFDDFLVAPTGEGTWSAREPVQFQLVEEGLRDLQVHLEGRLLDGRRAELDVRGDLLGAVPELEVRAQDVPVAYLATTARTVGGLALEDGFAGTLDAEVELRPGDAGGDTGGDPGQVHAEIEVRDVAIPGALAASMLRLDASGPVERPRVEVRIEDASGLVLAAQAEVPVSLEDASLGCDGVLRGRGLVAPQDLPRLAAALPALRDSVTEAVEEARLSADLWLWGPACDPSLRLIGAVELPVGPEQEWVRSDFDLSRSGEGLDLDAVVSQALTRRAQIAGTAMTGLDAVFAAALRGAEEPDLSDVTLFVDAVEIDIVPLAAPLEELAPAFGLPDGLEGRLGGGIHLSGHPLQPAITGGLLVVDGRLGSVPLTMAWMGVTPMGELYRLDGQLGFSPEGSFTLGASFPSSEELAGRAAEWAAAGNEGLPPIPLDVVLQADDLPIAAVADFTTAVADADGVLSLEGAVRGTTAEPEPDLAFAVREGSWRMPDLGLGYHGGALDGRLTRDKVELTQVGLSSRRLRNTPRVGSLTGSGTVQLVDFAPTDVDLDLETDRFWWIATSEYSLATSGTLHAGGAWPRLAVTGSMVMAAAQVDLRDSFFTEARDLALDPVLVVHRTARKTHTAQQGDGLAFWERFDLDVSLDLQRNFDLRAEMPLEDRYGKQFAQLATVKLDTGLDGVLRVRQEAEQGLKLEGELETIRGTAVVLGVDFAIGEGTISFLGDSYDNPVLDLEATRRTGSYGDVTVLIKGTAEDIRPEFQSAEYPDPTDVVSLILLGVPASELADSTGEMNAALMGAALSTVTGQVERALGADIVDRLEIDPSTNAVRAGRALSDKVFLTLEVSDLADDESSPVEITLEWLIARRMYAEFVTSGAENSAADLYWRWRF